jgi:hypothetical protein
MQIPTVTNKSLFLFNSANESVAVLVDKNSYLKIWKLTALGFKHVMDIPDDLEEGGALRHAQYLLKDINPTFMTYKEMNKMRKSRGL